MSTLNNYKNDKTAPSNREHPVLILGAGLNGLAAAYELKKMGKKPVILDGANKVAATWRDRHAQLSLNTHRLISHLPGMRIPKRFGALPSRDDMVLWVSVRNGPTVLPTKALGMPLQLLSPLMAPLPAWVVDILMAGTERLFLGDLRKFGLPKHPDGVATRLIQEGVAPAFDDGFVAALKSGRVTVLPAVEKLDGDAVFLPTRDAPSLLERGADGEVDLER